MTTYQAKPDRFSVTLTLEDNDGCLVARTRASVRGGWLSPEQIVATGNAAPLRGDLRTLMAWLNADKQVWEYEPPVKQKSKSDWDLDNVKLLSTLGAILCG